MPNRYQVPGSNSPLSPLPAQIHGKAADILGVNAPRNPKPPPSKQGLLEIDVMDNQNRNRGVQSWNNMNVQMIRKPDDGPELFAEYNLSPEKEAERKPSLIRSASKRLKRLSVSSSRDSTGDSHSYNEELQKRRSRSLSMNELKDQVAKPKGAPISNVSETTQCKRRDSHGDFTDAGGFAHRRRQSVRLVSFDLAHEQIRPM
jgi:hypothetical protein